MSKISKIVLPLVSDFRGWIVGLGFSALAPWIVALVTAALGYLERIPLMYAFVAASIVWAMVSFGAFYFHQLLYQRTADLKLRFGRLLSAVFFKEREDKTKYISGIKIGLDVNSVAIFSMDFIIEEIKTIIAGRINTHKMYSNNKITISAMGGAFFFDDVVDISGVDIKNVLDGEFEFTTKYGKPGHATYRLHGKYKIFLKFKSESEIEHFEWHQL